METGSLNTRSPLLSWSNSGGGGSQPHQARLTPMPTQQHRHTCLPRFNMPRHDVLHQGAGWGLDTRAPGRAGTWLGTEAPACCPTGLSAGSQFRSPLRLSAYEPPGRGLHPLPRCALADSPGADREDPGAQNKWDTHAVTCRPLPPHPSEPRHATQSVSHRPGM